MSRKRISFAFNLGQLHALSAGQAVFDCGPLQISSLTIEVQCQFLMSDPIELDMNDIYNYIKQERRIELSKILPTQTQMTLLYPYVLTNRQSGSKSQGKITKTF